MTRDEIIRELKYVIEQEKGKTYDTFSTNVRAMAQDCLRFIEEQHNPPLDENGLARCGCGNTLILRQDAGKCFSPYDDPSDIETWTRTPSWWVECSKCLLEIGKRYDSDWYDKAGNCEERGCFHSAEEAIKAANRAMGYKGADE